MLMRAAKRARAHRVDFPPPPIYRVSGWLAAACLRGTRPSATDAGEGKVGEIRMPAAVTTAAAAAPCFANVGMRSENHQISTDSGV